MSENFLKKPDNLLCRLLDPCEILIPDDFFFLEDNGRWKRTGMVGNKAGDDRYYIRTHEPCRIDSDGYLIGPVNTEVIETKPSGGRIIYHIKKPIGPAILTYQESKFLGVVKDDFS